jgi:cobalt-zinc-cadmium efflux system protein
MPHGSGHHHHHHHHSHGAGDKSTRNIGVAFWLNLAFALVELVGGIYTQSLAVISDALHDFGDAISLGIGYVLQRKSNEGPSEFFSYGKKRFSLLSAYVSGMVISGGAIYILFESITGFNEPREPNSIGMFGLALFGIAVNGFAAWRLSHGASHNERMMTWHLVEDVLGWVAVLAGSLLIYFFNWTWIDPLLAIGISIFVLYNVVRHLKATVNLFLQANPNPEGLRAFRLQVESLEEVFEIHDLHFWSLDGLHHVLSLHVVIKDLSLAEAVKEQVRHLSKILGDCHVTVEIESTSEHCHDDCEVHHEPKNR